VRLDEASSAPWFSGWSRRLQPPPGTPGPAPVAEPRTWLLRVGWRRHGLVDPAEIPQPRCACEPADNHGLEVLRSRQEVKGLRRIELNFRIGRIIKIRSRSSETS
jgi:hypothetical protein